MKRYVKTSSADFNSKLTEYVTFNHGKRRFSCHMVDTSNLEDLDTFQATVSEIHPYDDAEYTWAQIGEHQPLQVKYIRDGKVVNTDYLPDYDGESYETEDEYLDTILDIVAVKLLDLNKDVEPRMMYD